MKTFSRIFTAFLMIPAIGFVTMSCSDDDDEQDPNLIGNLPASVTLTANETENISNLKFTANLAWEAAYTNEESQWFSFTPKSGTAGEANIQISAPYNESAAKTGKLTIKHGTNSYEITINQSAGQPDLAQWNPQDLGACEFFAQDPFNATTDKPIELTFKVTTKQDYETLDEAPFDIYAFFTDADHAYKATNTQVDWVEFKIAENSPAANEGKKITLTVKPHDEFGTTTTPGGTTVSTMNNRYAFITIAPKGTQVQDMFVDGELKEEYEGYAIGQLAYSIAYSGNSMLTIGMPMMGDDNFDITSMNFKNVDFQFYAATDATHETPLNWLTYTNNDNHVVVDCTSGNIGQSVAMITMVNRGENLPPLELKHIKAITVVIMK